MMHMGSVDREVLTGEQPADLRQVQHTRKQLGCDIAVEQPIPVLAEYRRIPHWITPGSSLFGHPPARNGECTGAVMKEVLSLALVALIVLCFVAFVTTLRPTAISAIQTAPDHCRHSWGCELHVFAAVSGAVRQPWQLGATEFDASLTNAR
jgi:hypothetical protein